jgi:hypothetical protein
MTEKGVILDRIRHYLRTGKVMDATCFPASVVCFDELPEQIKPAERLLYGQYDKKSSAMFRIAYRASTSLQNSATGLPLICSRVVMERSIFASRSALKSQ